MTTPTSVSAERTVAAPAAAVFSVLRDPSRHHEADASTMVGSAVTDEPIGHVDQVFTMNMSWSGGGETVHYRTDNHVSAYEPDAVLAWRPSVVGEPPLGWEWRWDLAADDAGTRVRLTYDWTGTPPENIEQYGVPNFDADDLAASLAALAAALGG